MKTPFLPDDHRQAPAARPAEGTGPVECPWCAHTFNAPPALRDPGLARGGASVRGSKRRVRGGASVPTERRTYTDDEGKVIEGKPRARKKVKKKATSEGWGARDPNDDSPVDPEEAGVLAPIAARVLMKVLYGARLARFDLFALYAIWLALSLNGLQPVTSNSIG